ncbi:hypothetical protein ACE193_13530 [Bernardetia sp. OM2101]|uniref:hypothetical protein n=1 Tax=Bernardetia sp. OM2101 TaxID=3344876 RepID=UPI0035CF3B61
MKTLKTIAFASLVAFSTLTFTACDGTKSSDATTDTTAVEVTTEDLLNEADNAADNMMEAVDSTAAGMEAAVDSTEAAVEEATDGM